MRFDKRSIVNHVKHIHYTGRVSWFGPAIYRTFCKLDSYYFPLDHQSCRFEFGSSTYGSVGQGVANGSDRLDVGEFVSSGEWAVGDMPATATTITLPCCPLEKFDRVTYTLILQRNGANHLADTLLPIVLLVAMMVFSLYLPARSREKIFFSIIALLTLTMFRLSNVGLKPSLSDQTPLLGRELTLFFVFFFFRISSYHIFNSVRCYVVMHGDPTSKRPASDAGLCSGQLWMM